MKEYIYRREQRGYQERYAEGISAVNRKRLYQYSTSCMDENDEETFCYRQIRMDDGSLATGANYKNYQNSATKNTTDHRGIIMSHMLLTQADEVAALLDSYPSCSRYFTSFKEAFRENEQLHSQPAEMEIPMQVYLHGTQGGLQSAPAILKSAFHTPEKLALVFEALLDAASKNTRMVAFFGHEETAVQLAERGREIIEALFACLPHVIARYLGYISHAIEDKDNSLFCVRYTRPRSIGNNMRLSTYTFDVGTQDFHAPSNPNRAAKVYADELAELVFQADDAAFARIRVLKKLLNDEALYNAEDVPKSLALRYRFYNNPRSLSNEDIRVLLDWHNSIIDATEKGQSNLDYSVFWPVVDRWMVDILLPHLYANTKIWKDTDPVFSRRRVREVYAAGQRLFKLGRKEAVLYQRYFDNRLGREPMLDAAGEQTVSAELVKYINQQLKNAKDFDIESRSLYWQSIERWLRDNWCNGTLLRDRNALEAVNCIFEVNKNMAVPYMSAYVDDCLNRNISPLEVTRTAFGKAVYQNTLKKDTAYVSESMNRDLSRKNPCFDRTALDRFLAYRSMVAGNLELQNCYLAILDRCQNEMLSRINRDTVENAIAELNSSDQNGMISAFYQMDPKRNIRAFIEKRIVEVAKDTGVYPYYPEKPQLAADVAGLLDRYLNNSLWSDRLEMLKQAENLQITSIDDTQFHRLMEEDFGSHKDRTLSQKCKILLWSNIKRTFEKNPSDMKSLLMALALHNNGDGYFVPRGIIKDLESFDIKPKKFVNFCKKQAKSKTNTVQGLTYVAAEVTKFVSGKQDYADMDAVDYPGSYEENSRSRRQGSKAGLFRGVPGFVAVLLVVLGTSGFAASFVGLLNLTGLL